MAEDTTTVVAPSAPAASTPASAPAATTTTTTPDVKKPASFRDALFAAEKDATSASDPGTGTPDAAAATVLPTDASPANRGPVPYDRFSEVNTRMQTAEKRAKEIEDQHGWAKGLDKQTVHDIVQWRVRSQTDLPGFLKELIETAPADKLAVLRSELARQLGTRHADPVSDGEPQPDLQTDTGAPVYSAKQLAAWTAWREARQQAEFDRRFAPMQAELDRGKQERDRVESKAKAQTFATSTMKDAGSWPGFKENVTAIAEEYAKHPVGRNEAEESLALHRAYLAVLTKTILPTYDKTAEERVTATMQTKAAAGTAHPGRTTTAPNPNKPKSLGESLRREAEKAGWR